MANTRAAPASPVNLAIMISQGDYDVADWELRWSRLKPFVVKIKICQVI
jgi:hypothetical protein